MSRHPVTDTKARTYKDWIVPQFVLPAAFVWLATKCQQWLLAPHLHQFLAWPLFFSKVAWNPFFWTVKNSTSAKKPRVSRFRQRNIFSLVFNYLAKLFWWEPFEALCAKITTFFGVVVVWCACTALAQGPLVFGAYVRKSLQGLEHTKVSTWNKNQLVKKDFFFFFPFFSGSHNLAFMICVGVIKSRFLCSK